MTALRRLLSVLGLLLVVAACQSSPVFQKVSGTYVVVLGTAQDGGLPHIGCRRACCESVRLDPSRRRLVTSLLLADPATGQRWLFDASPDLREQEYLSRNHPPGRLVAGERPKLFDGIFLTHAHLGHIAGLLQLGPEAYAEKKVPTYVSARMAEFLRTQAPWSLLVDGGHIELQVIEPGVPITLSMELSVTPLEVPHRDEFTDTLAFVIKGPRRSLLYLPDIDRWDLWEDSIESWIERVDVALLDGTFCSGEEVPGRAMEEIPHPFIAESVSRFRPLPSPQKAKVLFTHLNHTNPATDPESACAEMVRSAGMGVAREGQVIPLAEPPRRPLR